MTTPHADETLNRRSTYLRVRKHLILVPVSMIACALLFAAIYTLVVVSVKNQRQYEQTQTLYIDFAVNEKTQEAYDYYNAATWKQLLFAQPLMQKIMEDGLPSDMTLQEAEDAVSTDLMSDIRVLTFTVTCPSKEDAQALTDTITKAVLSFGESAKEFDQISFLSETEPALVVVSDRTWNAVYLGLFLGLVFSVLVLWLTCVLDDAFYTPEDVVLRLGIPCAGVVGKDLPAFLVDERKRNVAFLAGEHRSVMLLSPKGEQDAKEKAALLQEALPCEVRAKSAAEYEVQAGTGAVHHAPEQEVLLLLVYAGEGRGTRLSHYIEQMKICHAVPDGIILAGADGRFLSQYYQEEKTKG